MLYESQMYSSYNAAMAMAPSAVNPFSHEHVPIGYLPVFGNFGAMDPSLARSAFFPRFPTLPLHEAAFRYQQSALPVMKSEWTPQLIAK